jgi:hypothetical protein
VHKELSFDPRGVQHNSTEEDNTKSRKRKETVRMSIMSRFAAGLGRRSRIPSPADRRPGYGPWRGVLSIAD